MFGGDFITPEAKCDFILSRTALARAAFPNFRDLAQAEMAVVKRENEHTTMSDTAQTHQQLAPIASFVC